MIVVVIIWVARRMRPSDIFTTQLRKVLLKLNLIVTDGINYKTIFKYFPSTFVYVFFCVVRSAIFEKCPFYFETIWLNEISLKLEIIELQCRIRAK